MKDNSTELQTEFFDLLNGNITYSGSTIAVYDTVPETPSYPYIQFNDKTSNDFSTKDTFASNDSLSLSIVDRFSGITGTRARINSVANSLFGIIRVRPVPLSLTNFTVIRCIVENDIFLRELTETYLYLRREIRFNLQLQQTT